MCVFCKRLLWKVLVLTWCRRKRSYTRTYIHLYERTPYPYEHLRKTELAYHLEIYEITIGTS